MGAPAAATERERLLAEYCRIREQSTSLVSPLAVEDMVVQTMPDVSPTKWHLAHTTWFFEAFLLREMLGGYAVFHPRFHELFNSYYRTVGDPYPRARRGHLSRPTVAQVLDYRRHVDRSMEALLRSASDAQCARIAPVMEVGLHHEQQHQELLLMDVKNVLAGNPLAPVYVASSPPPSPLPAAGGGSPAWCRHEGGTVQVGHPGGGFAFDNESPRHSVHLEDFELASRLVTSGEYLEFMADGGYRRAELWLADGWDRIQGEGWKAPLYWEETADGWWQSTLSGRRPVHPDEPVCHVSFYEADAFASWKGLRLPTEFEWEHAAAGQPVEGSFLESGAHHPRPHSGGATPGQLFGEVWQWTASAYLPYPGYRKYEGSLGEYNGKFMSAQMVLRGGCCVTPRGHLRRTYRNFYHPHQRWMFSGLRLARTLGL